MGRYSVHLVGESNYQRAVKALSPGDPVTFIPEPANPHDPRAIRVDDIAGGTIGYLERDSWLTRVILDDGTAHSATVEAVIGGEPGKPSRGVVLAVLTGVDARPGAPVPAPAPVVAASGVGFESPPMTMGKKLGIGCAAFLGLAFVGALLGDPADTAPTAPAAAPVPGFTAEPEPITTGGIFSATIAEGATPESMTSQARAFCADRPFCTVMAWREGDPRARAMPMVSRESETIAFHYDLNRATDLDRARWDCKYWPGSPETCLARD